jgi:hypothetical protein
MASPVMVNVRRHDNGQVSRVDKASLRYGARSTFVTLAWDMTSPPEDCRPDDVPYMRVQADARFVVRVSVLPTLVEAFAHCLTTPTSDPSVLGPMEVA